MTDFKTLVDALIQGTPWAVLIAAVGAVWQLVYTYTRDKANEKEILFKRELEEDRFRYQKEIEDKKFGYQKALETLRFDYEQRKWREQLALQLALKHVDARLGEYPQLWSELRAVAKHAAESGSLTSETAKRSAAAVESWRYSRGGLLAEETTRDAALALQAALWNYDSSRESFRRVRQARKLLRAALRADMGLGEDALGQSIFDATAARQNINIELTELRNQLGIVHEVTSANPGLNRTAPLRSTAG